MADYVDTATADLGREGRIERYPRIPSTQMPAMLRRLDVVVLPSRSTPRWREQYGRIVIEAMACGVPVIGSDSGEIPNVIGEAGVVFPEGDIQRLAEALRRIEGDRELRESLSAAGRARALAHFSQEAIAAETYDVYRELLETEGDKWESRATCSP